MLIDSHAHLTDDKLAQNTRELLHAAHIAGVDKVITIGTSILDSHKAAALAIKYTEVYAGVGVYPDEDQESTIKDIFEQLLNLSKGEKVVGIGETGIDIPKEGNPFNISRQQELFETHIQVSSLAKLPLIIHNREADDLVHTILSSNKDKLVGGVFHCYTSTWEFAKKVLDLGFYISFSGIITYKNAQQIQETAKRLPLDRILIETDAPYLTPHSFRGEVCEPKHVKHTAKTLASLLNMSAEKVAQITYNNAVNLFPLLGKTL